MEHVLDLTDSRPVAGDVEGIAPALAFGDELIVYLTTIPSSGYQWQLLEAPVEMDQLGSEFDLPGRAQENLPGAAVTEALRFRAGVETRTGRLYLVSVRPWIPVSEQLGDARRAIVAIGS